MRRITRIMRTMRIRKIKIKNNIDKYKYEDDIE